MQIALVTPLRDELGNLPDLFEGIRRQTVPIRYWVIVENDSTDGSRECLREAEKPPNVAEMDVLNITTANGAYQLGAKYAGIVNTGFDHIQRKWGVGDLDYIGILDADCIPEPTYFEKLVAFMAAHDDVGISSGVIRLENGESDIASADWVRGGCRLWKSACFRECGYIVGPSADTLSAIHAETAGWAVKVCKGAWVRSRETGVRSGYGYYGSSCHFRGIGPVYALAKALFLSTRSLSVGREFLLGYFGSFFSGAKRISDERILRYHRRYLWRVLQRRLSSGSTSHRAQVATR
jgi:glycosyltransferase involved in cell wall biosynthesis